MPRLPAEWEPHDAVLFAWPDDETDWAGNLHAAQATYLGIFQQLLMHCSVILAIRPKHLPALNATLQDLFSTCTHTLQCIAIETDDTWARDFGPIYTHDDEGARLLNFTFNGWGNKYRSSRDNVINDALFAHPLFQQCRHETLPFVLEGGAIESDGKGTLLTTAQCLLNTNRNGKVPTSQIEHIFKTQLGIERTLWLNHGYLAGDDTDSHIDTLARFAPDDTIIYMACDDPNDEHYEALNAMEAELRSFRTKQHLPYRLIALPWPSAKFDEDEQRLPATYANFLVSNGAVLVPIYQDKNDALALSQITAAFPDHKVIGIDCTALIQQHGSLHCICMHIPQGTLASLTEAE